jgi:alkylation response protein AidB-like acyl-CoA dehydrogenase
MTIVCRAPGGVSLIVAEREHLAGRIQVEHLYDLPALRGCLTARIRLNDVRVPKANLLGSEGQGVQLTRNAFIGSGASIGTFSVAAMRQAFDVAYRFALTERRGGAVPIIEHQAVADVLADAKARIEATRLLSWRALDAALSGDPHGLEWALHAKVFGSEAAVEVINDLIRVVGVSAYDNDFPLKRYLDEALAYPVIEGSNLGVRRRQMQALLTAGGYNPLAASGMA